MEPLRPWNVSEVSASRVPAREWCHLIRGVSWLRQAPFGRFLIANGIVFRPAPACGGKRGVFCDVSFELIVQSNENGSLLLCHPIPTELREHPDIESNGILHSF